MRKNVKINYILIFVYFVFALSFNNNILQNTSASLFSSSGNYGGTLIDSSTADATVLNPIISSDSASSNIESFIFEGMITYDKDMNIIPNLAQSWEISEDFLDYTFYLREDVYWHDGVQFTAADVIFTFERIFDLETDSTRTSKFDFLDFDNIPFEKIGQFTVKFHNKISVIPSLVLNSMNLGVIPQHAYSNFLGEDGIPFTADDCRDAEGVYTFIDDPVNEQPIGTGCMMFFEWEKNDHISIIRNSVANGGSGYWKEHDSYLDRYLLRIISDVNIQLLSIKAGEINMMDLSSTSQEDIVNLIEDPNINVYSAPTFTSDHIAFQCDPSKGNLYGQEERDFDENPNNFAGFEWQIDEHPEITGYLVRQAINYAVDKVDFIDYVYPQGSRNLGPIYLAQTEWYNEDVNPYDYNLTKANELLEFAGFGENNNDSLRTKLNFKISYNQGGLRREKTCKFIRDSCANLGIEVSIENLEWVSMLSTHYDGRNFDAMSAGWTGGGSDVDLSSKWSSEKIMIEGQPVEIDPNGNWIWEGNPIPGGLNYASYWNPTVDLLMDEARVEKNQNIRKMYYDQIQERIVDDSPYIWLLSHVNMIAVDANFYGFVDGSFAGFWPEPSGFRNIYLSFTGPKPTTTSNVDTEYYSNTSNIEEKILSRILKLPILEIGLIAFISIELRILIKVIQTVINK